MALMNIINIFHNDDVNRNNAQLVFNTHNPIFLDASLLRRVRSSPWNVTMKPEIVSIMRFPTLRQLMVSVKARTT